MVYLTSNFIASSAKVLSKFWCYFKFFSGRFGCLSVLDTVKVLLFTAFRICESLNLDRRTKAIPQLFTVLQNRNSMAETLL